MIEAYSVPCAPDTMARTGPGRAPLTTATGIASAASVPAGTSIVPRPVGPRAAAAVPTRKSCATKTVGRSVLSMGMLYRDRRRRRSPGPLHSC